MTTLAKCDPLGALDLPPGDHWVKFHVEENSISFEVASPNPGTIPSSAPKAPTNFVKKWGGSAKKIEDGEDRWLSHINEKHLR